MAVRTTQMREKNYCDGTRRKDYNEKKLCPRCFALLPIGHIGAISRLDNQTEICSQCGVEEALIPHIKV